MRPSDNASLAQVEAWLREQPRESAFAFDATGKKVWERHTDGFEVDIPPEDHRLIRGTVFTHNHPRGWAFPPDDPRRAGDSFSPEDISGVAIPLALIEIRAVSPKCRFTMKPARHGWPDVNRLSRAYDLLDETLRQQMTADLLAGRMSAQEMAQRNADHCHLVWQQLAELLGLVYAREVLAP